MPRHRAFVCQDCGYTAPKWLGQCPSCGHWQTMLEEVVKKGRIDSSRPRRPASVPVMLREIDTTSSPRTSSGLEELDRVLGGGLVKGSLILIGGDPGVGKSTLALQVCHQVAARGLRTLYVSGEESPQQIRLRAERLGAAKMDCLVLAETELENIAAQVEQIEPSLLVVDSVQTIYKAGMASAPGSVSQVRECAADLLRQAKGLGITMFLIGHVTKFGAIAGPKTLEHMVDTVLYFEGERFQQYRILRAVKNRFGATNEIGVFEMTEHGLAEVPNPSEFFLSGRNTANGTGMSGSAVVPTVEGSRPVLVEIQALAAKTFYPVPQRVANGFDLRRLAMLLCVLERRAGVRASDQDVFLNVAGGLRIEEPAADLGVAMALASSIQGQPVPADAAFVGEVGLGGEVRSVAQLQSRVREAERLGFRCAVVPRGSKIAPLPRIRLECVDTLSHALGVMIKT